jgi:hypothetical protein
MGRMGHGHRRGEERTLAFGTSAEEGAMATVCPCGCGRKARFSTQSSVVGAVRMEAMLAVISALVEHTPSANARTIVANGEQIRGWFLDHVHGDARPGATPDVQTLGRRMDEFAATVSDLLTPVTA